MTSRFMTSLVVIALTATGCATQQLAAPATRTTGWQVKLGGGTATSYAEMDGNGTPTAIGVVWSAHALDGLPAHSDEHRCFGRDKDGSILGDTKCQHTHEFVIPLPDSLARRDDIPFKWVLLNWNPTGHIPPGVYDVPHFDVHFEMGA